jgi:CPA2 family monovalent cation:H+ antiporter-2
MKILHIAHDLKPELPVLVRTVDDAAIDDLLRAGAAEVVPEIMEGSLMLAFPRPAVAGHAAARSAASDPHGARGALRPLSRILPRSDRPYRGDEDLQPRLHSVVLVEGSAAIGKRPAFLKLDPIVTISSIRRGGQRLDTDDTDLILERGDIVVLLGTRSDIANAEQMLLAGH